MNAAIDTAMLILHHAVRYLRMTHASKPVPLPVPDVVAVAILEDAAKRVLKGDL